MIDEAVKTGVSSMGRRGCQQWSCRSGRSCTVVVSVRLTLLLALWRCGICMRMVSTDCVKLNDGVVAFLVV